MADRTDKVILQYTLDQQGLNKAKQGLDSARQHMKSFSDNLKKDFMGVAEAGKSAFGSLAQDANANLGLLRASLVKTDVSLADLRKGLVEAETTGISAFKELAKAKQQALIDSSDPFGENLPSGRGGAGGGGRGAGLVGRSVSQIGSVLGGEAGQAVGQVGQLTSSVKELGVAGGIAGVAVLAVSVAYRAFNAELEKSKASLQGALSGVHEFYTAVGQGLTTQQAAEKVKDLQRQENAYQQERAKISEQLTSAIQQENAAFGEAGANALRLTGSLASSSLQKDLDELDKTLEATRTSQTQYTKALTSNILAANDAAAAEEKRLAAVRESLSIQVDYYRQYDSALKLSADAIRDKQKETLREYELTKLERDTLQNSNDKSEAAQAKIEQLNSKLEALAAQSEALTNALPNAQNVDNARKAADNQRLLNQANDLSSEQIRDRVVSIQEERKAVIAGIQSLKESGDTSTAAKNALIEYNKELLKLEDEERVLSAQLAPLVKAREDEAAAIAEQKKQLDDTVKATQKYNEGVAQINQRFHEQQAALAQKAADDQIRIVQQAADASAKAVEKLQQDRDKLVLDAARQDASAVTQLQLQQANAQLQYQRDEAKSLADHLKTLQKIRDDAQDTEFEQGLDRDFAGLAQSRRQTARRINEENQNYIQQQNERRQQLQQTLEDNQRSFEAERAERLVQLQQRLADAQTSYMLEQKQIEAQKQQALQRTVQTYQRDLQMAAQKHTAELTLRRQAIEAELKLISQGAQARLRLEADLQAALIAQAQAILGAVRGSGGNPGGTLGGGGFGTRAMGGGVSVGQSVLVNDGYRGQRESFNGQAFPPGMGIFTPLQNGRVDAGKGGGANVTINMPIQAGNNASPEAIAAIAEQKITRTLERIFQ